MLSKTAKSGYELRYLNKSETKDKEIMEVIQNNHCCDS